MKVLVAEALASPAAEYAVLFWVEVAEPSLGTSCMQSRESGALPT